MARKERLETYSPKKVNISIGGIASVTGWTGLSIDRNADNHNTDVGADGVTAYTVNADDTGSCEITVMQQNTEINLILAGIQEKDRLEQDITFFDIVISDKSGGVLCNLLDCSLKKLAPQALSAEATDRTHMFSVDKVEFVSQPKGFSSAMTAVANAKAAIKQIVGLSDIKKLG